MKAKSTLVGACLFLAVSLVGNLALPNQSLLSSQAWAQAQQLQIPDLSQSPPDGAGPQDHQVAVQSPAQDERPLTWKDIFVMFFRDIWESTVDQWPLIYRALQIAVLILVLFGYTVHHMMFQKRMAREKELYGDDKSRCSCGLPHGQCDWCKEDRA